MEHCRTQLGALAIASLLLTHPARAATPEYALPFALRPWAPPNVVRTDLAIAVERAQTIVAPTLTLGGKVASDVGVYARGAMVESYRSDSLERAALSNPAGLALYSPKINAHARLPMFLSVALPLGAGGGNAPNPRVREAMGAAVYARQAMDNALFAPNYLAIAAGVGFAHVEDGWTFQVEGALFQLTRTRGETVDSDASRANFTSGAMIGKLLGDVHVNLEVHYQRSLSTTPAIARDGALRDQLTVGGGVRANVDYGGVMMRPGVACFMGVDAPMARERARIVQLDLPILF